MPPRKVEPHLIVILGATGDLTHRKLLPALYRLEEQGLLSDKSYILGAARSAEHNDEDFRKWALESLKAAGFTSAGMEKWCNERLFYHPIGQSEAEDIKSLAERIRLLENEKLLTGNRAFYLALPPAVFTATIAALGQAGLNKSAGWTRIVIEKPFGRDLASAESLNKLVHTYYDESQIYRIDHYLGKETVQNLLAFRFGNAIFESLWNRDRIEHVCITVAEDLGVEHRAGYYEQAGAMRDMIQNHLTQLLTLTAMEIPSAMDADAIRSEKIKVLKSICPIRPENIVFGQYAGGTIGGKTVPGYLEEKGVAPDSQTETFVTIRLEIDNWRWQGVPFFLRTGKRMASRVSQIEVTFRRPPVLVFGMHGDKRLHPNVLTMALQPDEGFDLSFEVKAPGMPVQLKTQEMRFRYNETFGTLPEAYETLLLDIIVGDQTLFVHAEEAESSWRLYSPLFDLQIPLRRYPAGTWGPAAADQLIEEAEQDEHGG
jgi:glucose-6-phosphate 1-dehydrogenase